MNAQLTLDLGVLTNEQQERVDYFIRNKKSITERLISDQAKIEKLLIKGGFEAGIDYVNDFTAEIITENVRLGWDENAFETEITYHKTSGGCKIIYDQYNKTTNEVEVKMCIVSNEYDKLECSAITSQCRAYKPSSLLQKLKENNEKAQVEFNRANKVKSLLDYTVEKYKTLFPNSSVTVGKDYNSYNNGRRFYNYEEFETVKVEFKSGSYIIFRLGFEQDKEYIHKKFDAVTSKLNAIELLEAFDKQNISAS